MVTSKTRLRHILRRTVTVIPVCFIIEQLDPGWKSSLNKVHLTKNVCVQNRLVPSSALTPVRCISVRDYTSDQGQHLPKRAAY